ncbi:MULTISPECIES: FG-GAP-like repeat-containing protein [unclassified Streptomyces]|uniref:FG-GAP-like repeat-containing protein n=1 Tax=unclassified Streptomyces TaxID=2593676 RepID=UPI00236632EA|nr:MULTISPECIES: FG-GAP-like repeat-containing protein [unclassified Streptomyces]MDF3143607.1 FG-GAP-like repeat-containing protein [Streptomyces sp. T21Q-yed]WDF40763.1 FG-GAP-like repeat-containing protein [Streptomyces sp. T12]
MLSGAGVVTYAIADPSAPADAKRDSREPSVHTLKLQDRGSGRRGLDKRGTDRFSAVVLTWNDPDAKAKGTPEVRTRDIESGAWSGWQKVTLEPSQADGAEGARAALRGGTESVWTGDSDGIEVRLVNADGTEAGGQPTGMDVKLIDPGTDPKGALQPAAFAAEETTAPATETPVPTDPATSTETVTPTDPATPTGTQEPTGAPTPTASPTVTETPTASASPTASPSPTSTVPAPRPSTVVKPPVITQAEWGASTDYDGTPEYGTEIKAAVIHHTGEDSDNTLSCGESRARMRSIQQAHFSRGYFDVGYNFVVDKCGQIFEGRSGGMDLPVRGAHDIGFNTDTVGISYIGNFETAKPSRAAMDAISRIVAWKFGMYGIDPTGKVTLTSGAEQGVDGNKVPMGQSLTLPRVFGHRDTNATACPGANLYSKLTRIAQVAKTPGISHALATSDLNRDGITDLVTGTPRALSNGGTLTVVPGGIDGPVTASKRTLTQNSTGVPGSHESGDNFGAATAWGDVNGDGYADLAIGAPGEDDTSGHADRGSVTVLYGPGLDTGFTYTTSGSVTATGAKLGSTVTVGDFNGDGKADVFAAGTGKGGNWNARLTGGATATGTLTSATGAVAYLDAATGDFNRDGYADVALNYRDTGGIGRVVRFAGSATGLTKAGVISVKGGRSLAAGDVNGNGYDDIVIGQPVASESGGRSGGQITMVPGTSTGFTTTGMTTIHQDTTNVPGGDESGDNFGASVSVGDYNADGYADALAGAPGEDFPRSGVNQSNAGDAILVKGTSSGLTGTGSLLVSQDTSGVAGAAETGDLFGSSVSLTDLSGYGRSDLTFGAEGEDGTDGIVLYLPNNSTGLGYTQAVIYSKTTLGTPTDAHLGQTLTP